MEFSVRTIRLDSSPREGGLWCSTEGLTLAGRPLLEKTENGFAPASLPEIQRTFDHVFGKTVQSDASIYLGGLSSVARSLNKGDLPLAMIGSVLLKLPDLPQAAPERKLAFNDSQPRDHNGRWTNNVGEEARSPAAAEAEETTPTEAATASEEVAEETTAAELAPETIGLIARLVGILSGPVALAAATLIPTNKSNIHSGEFPDFPRMNYSSDEGVVTISRLDAAGNIETLYHGFPDAQGFYHDNGYVVGQQIGTGIMFDNEALADFATRASTTVADSEPDPASTSEDDDDKACPTPTPENINGRSNRSLAYQQQITGLPRGLDINYLGVRFDGCDDDTGRMMEAKGLGMDWMLNWPPDKLYQSKFYLRMMRQAGRQNDASEGRGDDYYFASKRMADFFGGKFNEAGYKNITVHQVDAIVKKIVTWLSRGLFKRSFVH